MILSINKTNRAVKDNIGKVALLVLVQFLILLVIAGACIIYFTKTLTNANLIIEKVSALPTNQTDIDMTTLSQMMSMQSEIDSLNKGMMNNLMILTGIFLLVWFMMESFIWFLSSKLINPKVDYSKYLLRFALLSCIFILPLTAINFSYIYSLFGTEVQKSMWAYGIINMIAWFFMFRAYSLAAKNGLKKTLIKTFKIKHIHKVLLTYLIAIAVIAVPVLLIYFFGSLQLMLVAAFMLLLLIAIVYSRILLISFNAD